MGLQQLQHQTFRRGSIGPEPGFADPVGGAVDFQNAFAGRFEGGLVSGEHGVGTK